MTDFRSSDVGKSGAGAGSGNGFISQLPVILWQRKWLVIVPFVIALIGAVMACILLPPVYRSSALMIVQSPQLPDSVTGGDNSEVMDRRIARIREQITSRPDLIALMEKYSLYRQQRDHRPLSEVIEDMRSHIMLTPTVADVAADRADQRTVAFELDFEYSEPAAAQSVTQELLDRILDLDSTSNATKALNMVQFLTEQAGGLNKQIATIQGRIADITARNGGVLSKAGVAVLGGGSAGYDMQISQLQRDAASLAGQKEASANTETGDAGVSAAEAQLSAARAEYSETHPDVLIAVQRLAEARALAASHKAGQSTNGIDQQIGLVQSQIAALRAAKAQDQGQLVTTMQAQARAPALENQIADLQEQLSALTNQYNTISDRLVTAQAGARADDQQMGERLSVADPPIVPDHPIKPNRLLVLIAGVIGGLSAGILLALAAELILSPIRDPGQLAAITGEAPLAIIPLIAINKQSKSDKKEGRRRMVSLAFWRRKNKTGSSTS